LKGCSNRNSFKRIICFYLIKDSILYETIITVFQFTQRAIENRSTCHAWHACRRLPTPVLGFFETSLTTNLRGVIFLYCSESAAGLLVNNKHAARLGARLGAVGTCPSIWQHRQFWLVNITILVLYRGFVKGSKLRFDAVS